MYEIKLNASFENWKLFWLRRGHPRFRELADQVFERDHHTCQFCGLMASGVRFEVVNLDNDYHNNKLENLTTACPLCAQCFFLESIGTGSFGGGILIQLPELTQAQLNAICQECFLAIAAKNASAVPSENILRDFKFRSTDIEKIFGDGMSDPAKFGTLMLSAMLPETKLSKILLPIRLLPTRARFVEFTEAVLKSRENTASDSDALIHEGVMA